MTSGEATLHLRELLRQKGTVIQPWPSSHSLKVTMLSWAAKAGDFNLSERQILGHRLDRPSVSALTYGRANFIGSLKKMGRVLERIADGSFRPDDGAASLVAHQLAMEEMESDKAEAAAYGEPQEADDSASEDLGQDEANEAVHQVVPESERKLVETPNPATYQIHRMSGTLHSLSQSGTKFLCGRPRTDNYEAPPEGSVYGFPLCSHCYRAQQAAQTASAPA